jgi:hypothetical protein
VNKFNAKRTEVDGITFDSKKEAARYLQLKLLQKAGQIQDLELQPEYPMIVNNRKVCSYRADFRYTENGKNIVEDTKGIRTAMYRLKAKLFKALYGFDIYET